MSLKLACALLFSLFCINAHAAYLCEIDRVEKSKEGIKVVFNKDIHPDVRGIKRSGSQKAENINAALPLILKEDDESGVYLGPHDFCTLKAEKRGNKLGIVAVANNHIPGITPTDRTEFILPVN